MDDIVIKQLTPMFPQLTPEVIRLSVQHMSNRGEPLDEGYLLQRCIDDLLELRTYTLESSFECPQDGRSQVTFCLQLNISDKFDNNIKLISDSPMQDYSTVLSSPSAGETTPDHELTVDTSLVPVVTDDTVGDQRPTVSHRPTHNKKHGQSTSALSGTDTDLPDIMSPKARCHTSTVSSAVTHNATLTSYFPSAVSHKAPSTSYAPAAATHNASASTYHTPVATTNNASISTYHTPAAAVHNAPASTYEMPRFDTQNKTIRTLDRPKQRLPVTDVSTPTFDTQKKTVQTLVALLASYTSGKQEHASATTATMSSASTSEKTTASPASMAVVNTVPLASAGTVVVKTVPLSSTSMACAKTIPLASGGMAGPNTVPSASSSTVGTANVTVPPASSGTASVPTPDVKLAPQETVEIPVTVPLCCVFTDADQDYVKDLLRHSFYPDPISYKTIYQIASHFGFHYAPTRRALTEAERCKLPVRLDKDIPFNIVIEGHVAKLNVVHLKGKRKYKAPVDPSCCPELLAEVLYVRQGSSMEQKVG
ncbi:hypothetical protein NP493_919g01069 [Ridgeia piscesae]|uniref:Uncharacterized protein n=1 Tax=Ridgeia piscesae TaxID=27915 RepID=A0AAD9NLQ0_RIDPI|nr:hypothetical protein NP493_919g01069 [Ridgeia piscesae]